MEIVNIRRHGVCDGSPLELISADRLAYLTAMEKVAKDLLGAAGADIQLSDIDYQDGDAFNRLFDIERASHALIATSPRLVRSYDEEKTDLSLPEADV
jgi:hypothetical protein